MLALRRLSNAVLSYLDKRAEHYMWRRENFNYDSETNGEFELLKRLSASNLQTIFDVGANKGLWALECCKLIPDATVHAFEPVPTTFEQLNQTLAGRKNVIANPFGLADKEGSVKATTRRSASELTSIVSDVSRMHNARFGDSLEIQVRLHTGDAYCAERNISHIDFLKLDTEGAEDRVLQGFAKILDRGAISIIQFEYGMANIYSKFLLRDFYDLLMSHGFTIGKLYPTGVRFRPYQPEHEDFRGPNYVAVHSSRADFAELLAAR